MGLPTGTSAHALNWWLNQTTSFAFVVGAAMALMTLTYLYMPGGQPKSGPKASLAVFGNVVIVDGVFELTNWIPPLWWQWTTAATLFLLLSTYIVLARRKLQAMRGDWSAIQSVKGSALWVVATIAACYLFMVTTFDAWACQTGKPLVWLYQLSNACLFVAVLGLLIGPVAIDALWPDSGSPADG